MCCDVCADQCKCETCTDKDVSISVENIDYCSDIVTKHPHPLEKKLLQEKLLQIRSNIAISEPASVIVGADILSGLTKQTINMIVMNSQNIKSVEDLQSLGVTLH